MLTAIPNSQSYRWTCVYCWESLSSVCVGKGSLSPQASERIYVYVLQE